MKIAIFGAGCFWGVEAAFSKVLGVIDTTVGYMGGTTKNPTYKDVCSNKTGHIEVVQIKFDPSIVSYKDLLDIFWNIHDPTQKNRQGLDIGRQYTSVIFYCSESQKQHAEISKNELQSSHKYSRDIVTEILPCTDFYPAEPYHQKYFEKHGMGGCAINH